MQLPIVALAPIVSQHAETFKGLFENQKQYRHFQNYLTGLIVLPNKSMANTSRCTLDSADKTNLSRFMSESPWFQEQVNHRRLIYLHQLLRSASPNPVEAAKLKRKNRVFARFFLYAYYRNNLFQEILNALCKTS